MRFGERVGVRVRTYRWRSSASQVSLVRSLSSRQPATETRPSASTQSSTGITSMATLPVRSACVQVRPKTRGVTRLEGDNPGEFLNKVTICNTVPRSDIGLDI